MYTTITPIIKDNIQTLSRLPYSFISVLGIDAEKFLQGQLSCDLSTLDSEHIQFGTMNTPKGRMYGLFKIARIENGFLLRLESSTVELFLTNIKKYKVFFKCEINIEERYSAFAYIASQDNKPIFPEKAYQLAHIGSDVIACISNSAPLFEIWSQDQNIHHLVTGTDSEAWFAMEAKMGIPELYDVTQDQFILQYLNLQDLGAVSFKKGCYTGQEIIARMKFLGKLKKKMFLLSSPEKFTKKAGADIFTEDGKKCGSIVRSHWSAQTGSITLAILSTSYSESNSKVYFDLEKSHPFTVSELNYAL